MNKHLHRLFWVFSTVLLASCSQPDRLVPMVASADPVFAQVISEETFRANLAPARAGDLRSIDIVYAYCLQKDMDASADYWERQRDIRESQLHMRDIPPARGRQPALPPPA